MANSKTVFTGIQKLLVVAVGVAPMAIKFATTALVITTVVAEIAAEVVDAGPL
jgi:hypothetical protein